MSLLRGFSVYVILAVCASASGALAQPTSNVQDFWRPVADTFAVHATATVDELTDRSSTSAVAAWGWNFYGQSSGAAQVPEPVNFVQVAAGRDHSLALRASGEVVAWGSNSSGQSAVPANLPPARYVAAGFFFSMAILEDGTLKGWGANGSGQINIPADIGPVIQADGGYDFTVALLADGTVRAWGGNAFGQTNVPTGLTNVVQVAASERHALALKANGSIVMWGSQTSIPLGMGQVKAIAGGYHRAAALAENGLFIWEGSNQYQIPPGVIDPDNISVDHMSLGAGHVIVRRSDGTLANWGNNSYGQASAPAGLGPVTHVATGAFHSIAALKGLEPDEAGGMVSLAPESDLASGVSVEAYPNPVRGQANVIVSLDKPGPVVVAVYDVMGREVSALEADYFREGRHALYWDTRAVAAGRYFVRVTTQESVTVQAILVAR